MSRLKAARYLLGIIGVIAVLSTSCGEDSAPTEVSAEPGSDSAQAEDAASSDGGADEGSEVVSSPKPLTGDPSRLLAYSNYGFAEMLDPPRSAEELRDHSHTAVVGELVDARVTGEPGAHVVLQPGELRADFRVTHVFGGAWEPIQSPDQEAEDVITVIIPLNVPEEKIGAAEAELPELAGHRYVLFLSQYRGGFSPDQRDTPYYELFPQPLGFFVVDPDTNVVEVPAAMGEVAFEDAIARGEGLETETPDHDDEGGTETHNSEGPFGIAGSELADLIDQLTGEVGAVPATRGGERHVPPSEYEFVNL